jgi:hypothetical protein
LTNTHLIWTFEFRTKVSAVHAASSVVRTWAVGVRCDITVISNCDSPFVRGHCWRLCCRYLGRTNCEGDWRRPEHITPKLVRANMVAQGIHGNRAYSTGSPPSSNDASYSCMHEHNTNSDRPREHGFLPRLHAVFVLWSRTRLRKLRGTLKYSRIAIDECRSDAREPQEGYGRTASFSHTHDTRLTQCRVYFAYSIFQFYGLFQT